MKSNIDLTENEIFSRKRPNISLYNIRSLFKTKEHHFDWDLPEMDRLNNDEDDTIKEIILTGNKTSRKEKRLFTPQYMQNYCHCCGRLLSKYQWAESSELCKKCMSNYTKKYGNKVPWRNKIYSSESTNINPLLW